jgi:hypothetical protein
VKFWSVVKTISTFSDDEEREFEIEAVDLHDAWDQAHRRILEGREQIVSVIKEES